MAPMRIPPTPGRRERPGVPPVVGLHRRWIAMAAASRSAVSRHRLRIAAATAGSASRHRRRSFQLKAALVAAAVATLALPASAHGGDEVPTQWQIDARAEALQRAPEPAEKPVICIIDTGVTPTPDLDIVSRTALDGGTPDDVTAIPGHYGHGTTVAHMAAAKVNGWGSSGAFPHARIASVRIFDRLGQRVPWQMYIRALEWCESIRPRPLAAVLSLGQAERSEAEVLDLQSSVEKLRDRYSINVVAASGNTGGVTEMPAGLPGSFAVTGSSPSGGLCAFSSNDANVDLAAPGCELAQADFGGAMWTLNGTSFAAPIAAGVLAAIRALRPGTTAIQAESALTTSAAPGPYPRLDVHAALESIGLGALLDDVGRPAAVTNAGIDSALEAAHRTEPTPQARPRVHGVTVDRDPPRPMRRRSGRGPRATLRRRGRAHEIVVHNRPRGSSVEVRVARRTIRRAASIIVIYARVDRVRVRFVSETIRSRWVTIVRHREGSLHENGKRPE